MLLYARSRPSGDRAAATWFALVSPGAVFWAEVLYGLIDAQVRFVPQVVRERKLPAPTSSAFMPRPTVAPLVLPGGGGLAIGGVF